MPQLNPEFFLSQLFWLVIAFSFLLIFLWRISLPRISQVLEKRETKINNDIGEAKKIQAEAEKIQEQIDNEIMKTREENAQNIKDLNINLQNKALDELKEIDISLSKKISEAANLIEKNKQKSIKEIDEKVLEITKLILSKLSSNVISDEEIKKVVASSSKKGLNNV
tara:strand:+ start:222 stop:722 length:501 start_codon:yes stop_codon:yes gene_type:complete